MSVHKEHVTFHDLASAVVAFVYSGERYAKSAFDEPRGGSALQTDFESAEARLKRLAKLLRQRGASSWKPDGSRG